MKIFFIGSVVFSEKMLLKCLELNAELVGIATLPNDQSDRVDLTPLAKSNGIPCQYTKDINSEESLNWIKSLNPEIIFCFGWSRLLKEKLLNLTPLGVIGYHPAALPQNRGRHPIIWAIALGLKETGSSFFFMEKGADTGDLLSQELIKIESSDDAATLYQKIIHTAQSQLQHFLPTLINNTHKRLPQDHKKANSWRKRSRSDGLIDWRMTSESISQLVKALTRPYPGAECKINQNTVIIWKCRVITNHYQNNLEPGKVLTRKPNLTIKTGNGAIELLDWEGEISQLDYL